MAILICTGKTKQMWSYRMENLYPIVPSLSPNPTSIGASSHFIPMADRKRLINFLPLFPRFSFLFNNFFLFKARVERWSRAWRKIDCVRQISYWKLFFNRFFWQCTFSLPLRDLKMTSNIWCRNFIWIFSRNIFFCYFVERMVFLMLNSMIIFYVIWMKFKINFKIDFSWET